VADVRVILGSPAGIGSAAPETVEVHGQNLENPSPFDGTQLTAGDGAADRPLVDPQTRGRGPGGQEYRRCRRIAATLPRWVHLSLL
jgi:hypothetical protein